MDKEYNPLISVIVPIYNVEQYIEGCIDSIVRQTYHNLEIILVDDGSTDSCPRICDKYASIDNRVKVIHKKNGGLVNARKAGIIEAAGDYAAYVDGDDWIDLNTYENLVRELIKNFPDVILYGMQEEYPDKTVEIYNAMPCGYYDKEELNAVIYPNLISYGTFYQPGILPNIWGKLVKRELLLKSQLEVAEDIEIGEDAVCSVGVMLRSKSIEIVKQAPYHYRKRTNSMMSNCTKIGQCRSLFENLYNVFLQYLNEEKFISQLSEYMYFVLLLKKYDLFIENNLTGLPFGTLAESKIALYGAGGFGQEIYKKTVELFPDRISIWVDKRYEVYKKQGLPIEPVEELKNRDYDIVLIAVLNIDICKQIQENLLELGIDQKKIRYVSILTEEKRGYVTELLYRGENEESKYYTSGL